MKNSLRLFRWPLIWDPDGIGLSLITNLHKDRKNLHPSLWKQRPGLRDVVKVAEAVEAGDVLILYDVKDYDSALAVLLRKWFVESGRAYCSST